MRAFRRKKPIMNRTVWCGTTEALIGMVLLLGCSQLRESDQGVDSPAGSAVDRAVISDPDPAPSTSQPDVCVQIPGEKRWLTATDMMRMAKNSAVADGKTFDFENACCTIFVPADGEDTLADVYFDAGIGGRVLHVKISKEGRAAVVTVSVLVD